MKSSDIVTQLAVLLPQQTAFFTDNQVATSVTRAGSVVTVVTPLVHGLVVGNAVALSGAITQIGTSSLTRSGVVGTIVTDADHDLTNLIATTITISGAVEAVFNGAFTRTNVENRRTITFVMADSGATTATGAPVLQGAESALRQYDGTYSVATVPTTTSFTVANSATTMLDPLGTINVRGKPRISAAVNPARMVDAYTAQELTEYWLFVALDDVVASKSRSIQSDAIDNLHSQDNFRQQIIQPFSLYLFIPAHDDIGDALARDLAEDMFRPICQSVLASRFNSGLFVQQLGYTQFVTHGTFSENTAVYVHAYSFQQVVDLYEQDTVGPDLDVAFRDLNFDMDPDIPGSTNTTLLTAQLDLDDVPL